MRENLRDREYIFQRFLKRTESLPSRFSTSDRPYNAMWDMRWWSYDVTISLASGGQDTTFPRTVRSSGRWQVLGARCKVERSNQPYRTKHFKWFKFPILLCWYFTTVNWLFLFLGAGWVTWRYVFMKFQASDGGGYWPVQSSGWVVVVVAYLTSGVCAVVAQ